MGLVNSVVLFLQCIAEVPADCEADVLFRHPCYLYRWRWPFLSAPRACPPSRRPLQEQVVRPEDDDDAVAHLTDLIKCLIDR